MLCLDDEVKNALKSDVPLVTALGGTFIYKPNMPGKESAFQAIFYREISNVPAFGADDAEKVSRITYMLSIYNNQGNLKDIINAAERVMIGLGFIRHSADPLDGLPAGVDGKKIIFITEREVD